MKAIASWVPSAARAALLLMLPVFPAAAARHALLVGIGDYPVQSGISRLEGPAHDVAALRAALVAQWEFPPSNVTILLDRQSTRANILLALESLRGRLAAGDNVFFYYSGHGTSAYDVNLARSLDLGLSPHTGAIIPADMRPGTAAEVQARMIVGMRDLRPILSRISELAEVLVVFDTCYSGMTARGGLGQPKRVALRDLIATRKQTAASSLEEDEKLDRVVVAAKEPPYPYSNVLYISASSRSEEAKDIPSSLLPIRPTIDNKPHGALTNSLLKGMAGVADSDHDGLISYQELYQFVQFEVSRDFKQFPQLLQPEERPMASRSIFGTRKARSVAQAASKRGAILVKLDTRCDAVLRAKIQSLPSIQLTDSEYDLLIERTRAGYALVYRSGNLIGQFLESETGRLVQRVARQPQVEQLISSRFTKQNFNIGLEILPKTSGTYFSNDRISFQAWTDRAGCPIIANIDTTGWVSIVFPAPAAQPALLPAGQATTLGAGGRVTPPFGVEYVKLFVFEDSPDMCARWAGKSFGPGDELFDQFLALAQSGAPGRAQLSMRIFSSER